MTSRPARTNKLMVGPGPLASCSKASALGATIVGYLEVHGRTVPWVAAGPDADARTKAFQQLQDDLSPDQYNYHCARGAELNYDRLIQTALQSLDANDQRRPT
jgi:hypothetical protein